MIPLHRTTINGILGYAVVMRRGVYKLIRGKLYFDTPSDRWRVLDLELEYNSKQPVVELPIVSVS